jgi:hypothetical protein
VIRRLTVWLVVIVTALAAGIALGGGPLSDIGDAPSQAATPPAKHTDPLADARAEFADAFPGSVGTELYAGRLAGQAVAVLTLPGADQELVDQLSNEVAAAGGEVSGAYALKRALLDVGEKTLVDTLGEQIVEQLGGDMVSADATTYDRIGQLIGRAVAARSEKSALAAGKVASLRASLKGARLLGVPDDEPQLASLVLVVTGHAVEPLILQGLVSGLAAAPLGVVVAGPTLDPGLASLRAEPPSRPVTTVDGTDVPAGRVATTMALVAAVTAPGGSFGASGSDGPVPLG